jgi:hypothetical protein
MRMSISSSTLRSNVALGDQRKKEVHFGLMAIANAIEVVFQFIESAMD